MQALSLLIEVDYKKLVVGKTEDMGYRLFLLIICVFGFTGIYAENQKSPHGDKLKIECTVCHTTENWKKIKPNGFNHNKTKFPLVGQHKMVDCRKCHTSLNFSQAPTNCNACHTDIHQGTVGKDCARCHTTNSWIVTKVRQMHQQAGFPLIGEHASADCNRCHANASIRRFDNIRSDCYSCHQFQYEATKKPNHKAIGFGTDCQRCHNMTGRSWNSIGNGFDHNMYMPLTGAHKTGDCTICHWDNYSQAEKADLSTKTDCKDCHSIKNADKARFPAHTTKYLKYSCGNCHNTTSWSSGVKFTLHDSWGAIYSGKHKGKWSSCFDCHSNDATYQATCTKCHRFSTGTLP